MLVEAADIPPITPFSPVTSASGISSQQQAIAKALTGPQYLSSQVQSPLRVPVQPFSPGLTPVINQGVPPAAGTVSAPFVDPTTGLMPSPQVSAPGAGGGVVPPGYTPPAGLAADSSSGGQSNTPLYVGGALAAGLIYYALTNKKHANPKPALNGLPGGKSKLGWYIGGAAVAGLVIWKMAPHSPS